VPPTEWGKIYALYKSLNESYKEIKTLLNKSLDLVLHKDVNHSDDPDPLLADLKRLRTPLRADHVRYTYASQQVFMECDLSISQYETKSRNSYLRNSLVIKHDMELGLKLVKFEKILPGSLVVVIQARDRLKSLPRKSVSSFVRYLQ
jgi:hypothetical protein